MGMLEDVLKALDRLPIWKRVSALPGEVDLLKQRLDAIEKRLAGKAGAACPICNEPKLTRVASVPDPIFGDMGVMQDSYECSTCKHKELRQRDPSS